MATAGDQINQAESNASFSRVGERLCVDFVNTKEHRLYRAPEDLLTGYPALLSWAVCVGILTDDDRWLLLQQADEGAKNAQTIFEEAITFRELLHRVFSRIAHAAVPAAEDLDWIKQVYVQAVAHSSLTFAANSFTLALDEQNLTAEHILWAVARSAIEVLTTDDLRRVKECPGIDDCGYLFLDISKNGTRHWCSMAICGSRAKMRRQYARKQKVRIQNVSE